jgi:hypothetical protein
VPYEKCSTEGQSIETLPEEGNVMPKHVGVTVHKNLLKNCCICLFFFCAYFYWDFNF